MLIKHIFISCVFVKKLNRNESGNIKVKIEIDPPRSPTKRRNLFCYIPPPSTPRLREYINIPPN